MPRRGSEPVREASQDGNGEENQTQSLSWIGPTSSAPVQKMQPVAEGKGREARDSSRTEQLNHESRE
jgi:hypothetical protein